MATSSPLNEKQPRPTTLGLDKQGYYLYRKNTMRDRQYAPADTPVDALVDLIVDHCTKDLGPFA